MAGKRVKMGNFMMQKWPCILSSNLNVNQVKNMIKVFLIVFGRYLSNSGRIFFWEMALGTISK